VYTVLHSALLTGEFLIITVFYFMFYITIGFYIVFLCMLFV